MTMIEVTTGARLHFGLLCGKPDSAWHYGGIGMMIESPAWKFQLAVSDEHTADIITASEPVACRINRLLSEFRQLHGAIGPVVCSAIQEMDFHSGLGSGTQLTLAISSALLVLSGKGRPNDITPFAEALGRSQRSAIGTFGFDHGGFIIDLGKNSFDDAAQRRILFPDAWRMVLISPASTQGLSGQEEETFFGAKDFLDDTAIQQITNIVDSGIIPSLKDQNYRSFTTSLARYGELIGEYYASEQGGIFSSPVIRELAEWLNTQNHPLPVQSSWGPTVCIPAESAEHANILVDAVSNRLNDEESVKIIVSRGLNSGATLKTVASEGHRSFG